MKAVVIRQFGGPEVLHLERDFPMPVPGPGEVTLAVHAVSVNRTLDLAVRAGTDVAPIRLPHIPGVDPSGVITALGPGVTERRTGERVVTLPWRTRPVGPLDALGIQHLGGYAEYVKSAGQCDCAHSGWTRLCNGHGDRPSCTAGLQSPARSRSAQSRRMGTHHGCRRRPGQCGRAGCKAPGAHVIAAAGTAERVAAALGLGADHGINYAQQDLTAEALRITEGRGVNVVFENIADPKLFPKAFHAIARHGRLVTAGSHGGGTVPLDVQRLYLYQIAVMGSIGFTPADVSFALQEAAAGQLRALIDRILPLSRAAEAHELVANRAITGKIVLDPTLPEPD